MPKSLLLASLILFGGLGALAYADDRDDVAGPDWISFEEATQRLHQAGYSHIIKLKPDDGYWKAKVEKSGLIYKVRLDPRSGDVASAYRDRDDD